MTIEQELKLSYYQQVADINAEHSVFLVQDVRTKEFYVKKLLRVYNADIYHYLQTHPVANTPKILLAEEDQGILTVIEEYIPGETLETKLAQAGVLSEEDALSIAIQLCKILAEFHHCTPAIVNRDVKPSNIKISPDGVVKLVDMNAAKWSNAQSAKDTVLLGTQGYAAPEQYGFASSSIQTDIYAVGVLINVMLTGQLPNQRMADGKPGQLVRKCVELSPAGRYESMDALLLALQQLTAKKANWKKYLPPGFRHNNPIGWLASSLCYFVVFYLIFNLNPNDVSAWEAFLFESTFAVCVLCAILFGGNYLNIHSGFVLTQSKHRLVKWLGIAIVAVLLFALWIILYETLAWLLAL